MIRSELSLKRELNRVQKLLRKKKNTAWTDAQITGAQQALQCCMGGLDFFATWCYTIQWETEMKKKRTLTIDQIAEHIVTWHNLTPDEIGEVIDELIRLRYKAL